MEQTENYYTGCASATETVSEIRDDLEQYREKASDETRYFSMIQKLADTRNDLSWDSHSHTLSFSVGISETQQLSVVLEIFYPQKKKLFHLSDPTMEHRAYRILATRQPPECI